MSKRDIETVCELSAHLALRDARTTPGHSPTPCHISAPMYAKDAMTLQRLARNIRNKAKHIESVPWGTYLRVMCDKGEAVLKPYGLVGEFSKDGITIIGLPSNGDWGDSAGFAI